MSAGANRLGKGMSRKGASSDGAFMMVLFSTTIFTSAALLFLVEPMFAKFILPLFGSTPAVWTGSMMFFQAALLVGYLYVHATAAWLGARKQAALHLGVVLLPLLLFALTGPIGVPEGWNPPAEGSPILYLLGLMTVAVGLPFFAISTTNPLIQRWLADTDHPSARDPYFLYRASNIGSVIGLLGYPLVVERELTLTNQGLVWTLSYGLLVILVFASAVVLWRSAPATGTIQEEEEEPLAGDPISGAGSSQVDPSLEGSLAGLTQAPTLLRRLRWVGLAFVPSSFMLGVTAFITTDVTPIPLLWVLPLSLYLFSFVVVFSSNQRTPDVIHKIMVAALPVVMAVLVVATLTEIREPYWLLILLHLFGFFVAAMVLHGELARDRPPARNLTEFWLWVSVGGVLGGVFNAIVAPLAFDAVIEYPLAIVLTCLFLPGAVLARLLQGRNVEERAEGSQRLNLALDLALPVVLGVVVYAIGTGIDLVEPSPDWILNILGEEWRSTIWQLTIGLGVGICLFFAYSSNRPIRFGLAVGALILAVTLATGAGNTLFQDRSFFGVYRISQQEETGLHSLSNGSTNHGAQFFGVMPPEPITYYHRTGPIGQLFEGLPEETTSSPVAAIGLGTGSMACYNSPGQQMTFYEIDPLVQDIARDPNYFTYLDDCPGENEVVLGDARLQLENAPDGEYGVIVADAFSSDAIPVHLMTSEALDLYLDKLQENGALAIHISNRHLELEPVLGNLARNAGLSCYAQFDAENENEPGKFVSHWVTMARSDADLGSAATDGRWQPCATNDRAVWTDDYSNLLSTLNWG